MIQATDFSWTWKDFPSWGFLGPGEECRNLARVFFSNDQPSRGSCNLKAESCSSDFCYFWGVQYMKMVSLEGYETMKEGFTKDLKMRDCPVRFLLGSLCFTLSL